MIDFVGMLSEILQTYDETAMKMAEKAEECQTKTRCKIKNENMTVHEKVDVSIVIITL